MAQKTEERVRPIVLKDTENGDSFTLEFNRESVKFAESKGFKAEDIQNAPMTKIPELFYYAFRMHHRAIPRDKTDKILYDDLGGLSEALIERLVTLYIAPYECLIQNEENAKNSKMTVEL